MCFIHKHKAPFYLCRNNLYTIHFSVVSSVGLQSFMEEANLSKDRVLSAWSKSQFSRDDCKIKQVTSSVYVIKRVRVPTFAGQSIDHGGVVDKLKKLIFDKNQPLVQKLTNSKLARISRNAKLLRNDRFRLQKRRFVCVISKNSTLEKPFRLRQPFLKRVFSLVY